MRLTAETKTFRCDSEEEAIATIQKYKDEADGYEVKKSGYTMRTKKSKGEIIDLWYVTTVTLNYDLEA